MDLEQLIRNEVNKAVKDAVSSITIKQEVINDRWVNRTVALTVLGIASKSTLATYEKKKIIKSNKLGFYKYSELLNIK
jgi:hypothetical protein